MIVGIDANRFIGDDNSSHEQVLINLLKGFNENGVGNKIAILCHEDRYDIYKSIIPEAKFYLIPSLLRINNGSLPIYKRVVRKIKSIYNQNIVNNAMERFAQSGIDVLFFSTKRTLKKKVKIPTIFNPQDIQNIIYPDRWKDGDWLRLDFKFRDYAICISDFDKEEMLHYLPEYAHKIKKIYEPIIYGDDVYDGERKDIVCLNVNVPHKNCITILKAFNKIKNKTDYNLTIIGKFNNEQCIKYIKDEHLEDRVTITGYISEDDLKERLRKARLYVSASTYEGFGMTPVEAIIQGVPTIVYKGTASYETTQGLAMYYENATNEIELANVMMGVLNKPISVDELTSKSKKLQSYYNYRYIAKQYWNLFEEVVNKNHQSK